MCVVARAVSDPSALSTCAGSRLDYAFVEMSRFASAALGLAVAATAELPAQMHLAIAGTDGMRASWKTNSSAPSTCAWGLSANSLGNSATGTSVQYIDVGGFHHHVKMTGLSEATKYFYSCGDGTPSGSSPVRSFTTSPGPTGTVSMAIFGDWGYLDSVQRPMAITAGGLQKNYSATLTRELLETLKNAGEIDATWMVGDIGYADDSFGHDGETLAFGYEVCYDGWMGWIENVSSVQPWMVSVGNHESECHDPYCLLHLNDTGMKLNNFSAYNARWAMPSAESGGVANMWYSFRMGPVHVVSINTETDFPSAPEGEKGDSGFLPAGHFAPDGTYLTWLASDLAAASSDPSVSWIIAGGHRPFGDTNDATVLSLFKQYNVSMYFAGHTHSYLRYDKSAFNGVTAHVVVGGAGCDEMPYPSDQLAAYEEMEEHQPGASPASLCKAWCQKPDVRAGFSVPTLTTADASGTVAAGLHTDPCSLCTSARTGQDPLYVSDNMAIGVLQASPTQLQWQLLRAPDGLVLDTLVITK